MVASCIPPRSTKHLSTVIIPSIMVTFLSAKCCSIMIRHCIMCSSHSCTLANGQSVVSVSSAHFEQLVGPHHRGYSPVPQFNPQFHVLSCGEAVYVLQSIPKFSLQVSKPIDIVSPVQIEINRAINPTLYDHPLASITRHVTASVVRLHCHSHRSKWIISVLTYIIHFISTSSRLRISVLDLCSQDVTDGKSKCTNNMHLLDSSLLEFVLLCVPEELP